jgi:hypothetical protein
VLLEVHRVRASALRRGRSPQHRLDDRGSTRTIGSEGVTEHDESGMLTHVPHS